MTHVGRYIQMRRYFAGMSQRALAMRIGCSHVHISHVEKGLQLPTENMLRTIVDVLGNASLAVALEHLARDRPLTVDCTALSPDSRRLVARLAALAMAGELTPEMAAEAEATLP